MTPHHDSKTPETSSAGKNGGIRVPPRHDGRVENGNGKRADTTSALDVPGILDALPDGLFIVDPEGRVQLCNAAADRLLGHSATTLAGAPLPTERGGFDLAALAAAAADPSSHGCAWREIERPIEGTAERGARQFRTTRIVATRIRWPNGTHTTPGNGSSSTNQDDEHFGLIFHLADVSGPSELLRLRSDLLDGATHELHNPLKSIQAGIELLLSETGGQLDLDQVHILDLMQDRVLCLQQLITHLLDLSRLATQRLSLDRRPTDLVAILHRAVNSMALQVRCKNIKLDIDAPEELPMIHADPQRVEQLVVSLVDLAVPRVAGEGGIRLGASVEDGTVVVCVDAGEAESRHESARPWGHGASIAFTVAREVMTLHGGGLEWCGPESGPGAAGGRFSLWFPPVVAEESRAAA